MSRGLDGNPRGDITSARRKKERRAAAAQAQREKRRRLKVTERKHARGFLRTASAVANSRARDAGWKVRTERTDAAGNKAVFRWSEAVVQLAPVDISIRFSLGDKRGTGSSSTIRVHAGRKLIRTCPAELIQSGNRREFADWMSESLDVAVKRSSAALAKRGSGEQVGI